MIRGIDFVESAASFARANPGHELTRRALAASVRYLELYRPPHYESYVPSSLLKERIAGLSKRLNVEPTGEAIGDPELMLLCLEVLVQGAQVELDCQLVIEVFAQDDVPCVALSFDGFGRFCDPTLIGGMLPISMEELETRWTLATRGGRIDPADNGLLLKLKGVRMPAEATAQWELLRKACGEASKNPCVAILDNALAVLTPGEQDLQPGDLNALITEVLRDQQDATSAHGIKAEFVSEAGIPPILISRTALRRFFERACQTSVGTLTRGGTLTILSSYDAGERQVNLVASIEGTQPQTPDAFLLASMRRSVDDIHGGVLDVSEDKQGLTLSVTLPDRVGAALDAWIPGFDVFTERSRQVLRLVKAPGCALPVDVFLAGVLDEELTQWLVPCLEAPMARNVAHDLAADVTGLAGANRARVEKALDQIRRGKPRKEIAKPPYVGEMLYAFRKDARHREAVGAGFLDEADFLRLCRLLMETPANCAECLRLVAAARRNA